MYIYRLLVGFWGYKKCGATSFCRIVILPKQKIAESHLTESSHGRIVEFVKLHNAERHFFESLFSRTWLSRNIICPNTLNRPPAYTFVQCACRRAAIKLIGIDVLRLASKICVVSNWVRVWTCLTMDKVRIREVRKSRYGRFDLNSCSLRSMQFSENNVRLNGDTRKWRSAKRRFEKMTFG